MISNKEVRTIVIIVSSSEITMTFTTIIKNNEMTTIVTILL